MIAFNLKNQKGFTLLEALVAISILMVAVVAPITIAQKGLSSATYSKNQLIASYLAQDAIEYIKNKRDVISINNNFDWNNLSVFGNSTTKTLCFSVNGCQIDTNIGAGAGEIRAITATPLGVLSKNTDGFYGFDSPEKTNFTRKINIKLQTVDGENNEALVTVTVNWGSSENEVVVRTLIYNY